jgi:hypothetical protein
MIPVERGTWDKPIHVTMSAKPSLKDTVGMILITVLPVAIAILMQKPALRQAIVMRTNHIGKEFCQIQADFWSKGAATFATAYNKAKL